MDRIRRRCILIMASRVFIAAVVFGIGSLGVADDHHTIAQLKEIQKQTSLVASKNVAACVAITDGVGSGSGVIVSEDGLVLTAGHVIIGDRDYQILFANGRIAKAIALGKNLNQDAGMLQIVEPGPWPFVDISADKKLRPGDWVVSMGHSGGFETGRSPPVRTGRVLMQSKDQIVTDAVLIGGDSGGPLFDLAGKLIGIHSSIGDTVAENRHVTMDVFVRNWERLKRGEQWGQLSQLEVPREESPSGEKPPEENLAEENPPEESRLKIRKWGVIGVRVDLESPVCLIKSIDVGSAASESGIQAGDIVKRFNGVVIRDGQHLVEVASKTNKGDVCSLYILRRGNLFQFEVKLK